MKKEDLSKVNGGMHIFLDDNARILYATSDGYYGERVLCMVDEERDILHGMGYEPIQYRDNFESGHGGYIVRKKGKFIDPQKVLEVYKNNL